MFLSNESPILCRYRAFIKEKNKVIWRFLRHFARSFYNAETSYFRRVVGSGAGSISGNHHQQGNLCVCLFVQLEVTMQRI